MKASRSRLFKCSLVIYSFTELPAKASVTIASNFYDRGIVFEMNPFNFVPQSKNL
jgi:hypothetical protein